MIRYVNCCMCGKELYYADETHYQDDCFKIEGEIVCPDCLEPFCKENYYMELSYEEPCEEW